MTETLDTLQSLFTIAFVVSSMLVMGVSLTIGQIIEPLRNIRLVVLGLVASFVVVPGTAFLLKQAIPMSDQLQIGLILMSTAHGAPFLPKVTQVAKGSPATRGLAFIDAAYRGDRGLPAPCPAVAAAWRDD